MRRANVRPARLRRSPAFDDQIASLPAVACPARKAPAIRLRAVLSVAVLSVLMAMSAAQPSTAASKLSAKAPRSVVVGTTVTVKGRTTLTRASSVVVQRAAGRRWKTLASGKVRKRKFSVRAKLGPSIVVGTVRLRVVARRKAKTLSKSKTFSVKVVAPKIPGATGSTPIDAEGGRGSLGGDYPDADAVDCSGRFGIYSWCKGGTWISPRGYGYRNCVDYVAWVLNLPRGLGNAKEWKARASRAGLTATGSPSVGDVAWWGGGSYGHVAVVTAVYPSGAVDTVDYNGDGRGNKTLRRQTRADAYLHPAHPPAVIVAPPVGTPGPGAPASPAAIGGDRIAVRYADGTVAVKENGPAAPFTTIASSGAQVELAGDRIAVVYRDGTVAVKDGIGGGYTTIATGAAEVKLAGDRIAVRFGDGTVAVKDGIGGTYTTIATGAAQVALAGNRIGVVYGGGTVAVKDGIGGSYATVATGATQVDLGGDRMAVRFADGTVAVKDGIGGSYTTIANNGAQVELVVR